MLKVVGWTFDTNNFRTADLTDEEIGAVIKDIRDTGYSFCGDDQETYSNCTPVLSNGKKVTPSWRGWGAIMAKAHNMTGPHDYILWYMHDAGPKNPVYPPNEPVKIDEIESGVEVDYVLTKEEENFLKTHAKPTDFPKLIIPSLINGTELFLGDMVNIIGSDFKYSFKLNIGMSLLLYLEDDIKDSQYENMSLEDFDKFMKDKYGLDIDSYCYKIDLNLSFINS